MNRILFVRGGAIGDFILTLPAIKAVREAHPRAHIEILGYKHIAALAENRFYAEAARSIEYGSLSSFFARDAELHPELRDYFGSFDLVVSYLYDPDSFFENNLRRSGVRKILRGPAKIHNGQHSVRQLLRPIEEFGLPVSAIAPRVYPSTTDREFARNFLSVLPWPICAIHPGSGSEKKNWPIQKWIELANYLLGASSLVVVAGEADAAQADRLEREWKNRAVLMAKNLPLPQLAAVLQNCVFIGHDSGISHLAAAAGSECVLLFGPTDPAIWAPLNENARVLRAPDCDLQKLEVDVVREAFDQALMRIGIRT